MTTSLAFDDSFAMIQVSISRQTLSFKNASLSMEYSVSTASKGAGQLSGSECTPLGEHYVRAKIGKGEPERAVYVGRRPTGEIYSDSLALAYPKRDWILTRIIWLCGTEIGVNRLGSVDTMRRYIYIHGTPDSEPMGVPRSHGCIRMRNNDIIQLFNYISVGTPVSIQS